MLANVGSPSTTLNQHQTNIGLVSCAYWGVAPRDSTCGVWGNPCITGGFPREIWSVTSGINTGEGGGFVTTGLTPAWATTQVRLLNLLAATTQAMAQSDHPSQETCMQRLPMPFNLHRATTQAIQTCLQRIPKPWNMPITTTEAVKRACNDHPSHQNLLEATKPGGYTDHPNHPWNFPAATTQSIKPAQSDHQARWPFCSDHPSQMACLKRPLKPGAQTCLDRPPKPIMKLACSDHPGHETCMQRLLESDGQTCLQRPSRPWNLHAALHAATTRARQ